MLAALRPAARRGMNVRGRDLSRLLSAIAAEANARLIELRKTNGGQCGRASIVVARCSLAARPATFARSKTPRRWRGGCCDDCSLRQSVDAVSLPAMRKRRHHRSASPRDHVDRESFGVSETTESAARARERLQTARLSKLEQRQCMEEYAGRQDRSA